ncbi:MAG: IS256 family transposase [Anaerolineae bacterium]|nr:IS256 family transposase [Anaerolineae bacterium]
MKQPLCSLPTETLQRQSFLWQWIDREVQHLVVGLIQMALAALVQEQLQAGWNQRTPQRQGWRNGYRRRDLTTPHGVLTLRVPRLRQGTFDPSVIFERYQRRIADVERVLRHAYLLGVSTRDTAKLAEQLFGEALSHQTISGLMRWLDTQLARWRKQPITSLYPVIYVDGMHVNRVGSNRTVMLVAGRRASGVLDVLGFCVSTGEQCTALLSDLRRRGLEDVRMVVSDESGAIRSAVSAVYPEVAWQHCIFHRLAQLRRDIGATAYRDRMLTEAACVFRCPSREAALEAAGLWRQRWWASEPVAVAHFLEDLCDSVSFYDLPITWWKWVRTNNPLERLIRTLRQRLRPMGCFHDEPAIERAVFGQLLRRHKIKLTHNT